MAKNEQEEAYEKLMSAHLARTIDFVKFGETKNGALLAFCSVWIVACINILSNSRALPPLAGVLLPLAILLFLGAALTAITAFLPQITTADATPSAAEAQRNLLFFGDIARMDTARFEELARERYTPASGHFTTGAYLHDIATQIVANSAIAMRKYVLFRRAARIAMTAIFLVAFPYLVDACLRMGR